MELLKRLEKKVRNKYLIFENNYIKKALRNPFSKLFPIVAPQYIHASGILTFGPEICLLHALQKVLPC